MDRSIYIAATSAHHNNLSLTAHANNLANIDSTGFKHDLNQTRAMPIFGQNLPTRAFALTEQPATDLSQGKLQQTDNPLDITTNNGLIAVQNAAGEERYISSARLQIGENGDLTANNLAVVGTSGTINLQSNNISVNSDGSINAGDLINVDRIKLVSPNPKLLFKDKDGLLASKQELKPADNATITSGMLELSNVNLVEEMTQMLELTKHFELNLKMMHATDTNQQSLNNILQIS